MNRSEQQREHRAELQIKATALKPSKATLNTVEQTINHGVDLLTAIYNQWDTYDTLTQQRLPQADYNKAIRLTELARNTLEKFLDELGAIKQSNKTEVEAQQLVKRVKISIKSLENYFQKVGIDVTLPSISEAA